MNMKNKIKALVYSGSAVALTVPALAMAQFTSNAGGGTNLPSGSIMGIVKNIMNWLLGLVGILGVIGFAIAGILYLTAAGDEGRIETAKSAMTWSIVGVVVAIIGVVILKAAETMLGGGNAQF